MLLPPQGGIGRNGRLLVSADNRRQRQSRADSGRSHDRNLTAGSAALRHSPRAEMQSAFGKYRLIGVQLSG